RLVPLDRRADGRHRPIVLPADGRLLRRLAHPGDFRQDTLSLPFRVHVLPGAAQPALFADGTAHAPRTRRLSLFPHSAQALLGGRLSVTDVNQAALELSRLGGSAAVEPTRAPLENADLRHGHAWGLDRDRAP